jgi:hypothetical protein
MDEIKCMRGLNGPGLPELAASPHLNVLGGSAAGLEWTETILCFDVIKHQSNGQLISWLNRIAPECRIKPPS